MIRALKSAGLAALFSSCVLAQPATTPLSFEVADVQVSKPGGKPHGDFLPGGKVTIQSFPMKGLIAIAWDLPDDYVIGGPAWLNSEHYDIVAKAVTTAPLKELRLMLQTLLIERFKLQVHHDKKAMPVYALVAGKKAVKLQERAAGDGDKPSCKIQGVQQRTDGLFLRSFICKKTSMEELANRLPEAAPAYVDLPVVNLTDLKGLYDFTLAWTPTGGGRGGAGRGGDAPAAGKAGDMPAASEPDGVTLFDALQSQLGLKLEPRKYPMDILVIDKVERVPTEN
jgi:uncharacterized protein (TIGR03435 family)